MPKSVNVSYNPDATVKCSNCGSLYTFGSTVDSLVIEVCGNCHPFYTGQDTIVDTAGRIEKYQAKLAKAAEAAKPTEKKKKARKVLQSVFDIETPKVEA
jgi:large subunit ribosomal protein L31